MSERYQGGYITATVVNPDGIIADNATATGVWALMEQFVFNKASLWPTINARGVVFGGYLTPANTASIDFVEIATTGNSVDFGDLTSVRSTAPRGNASLTRGLIAGGANSPSGDAVNIIEYITISTTGDSADFGDLQAARTKGGGGIASKTRSVFFEGSQSGPVVHSNVLSYITTATLGNATDFGDVSVTIDSGPMGMGCSPTRGVMFHPSNGAGGGSDVIEYITIASTGNTTDFGNNDDVRDWKGMLVVSSSVRAVYQRNSVTRYITIASTGDTTDFGEAEGLADGDGANNNVRGLFLGGDKNNINMITIASVGDAADFGDLSAVRVSHGALSQGNGGHQ